MRDTILKSIDKSGFIEVVDYLGDDTTVVNSARVSFGKSVEKFTDKDTKLVNYLAKNRHSSPFRHCYVQIHVKAPEFVARQWFKHCIGAEYTFKDQPWNEISGRYVEYSLEGWEPTVLRGKSSDKKQGSTDIPVENNDQLVKEYKEFSDSAYKFYDYLIKQGVCSEQARTILPVNFYTEWYWTASLQAIHHFVKLRDHDHAQLEIRKYAQALNGVMLDLYPNCWKALNEHSK